MQRKNDGRGSWREDGRWVDAFLVRKEACQDKGEDEKCEQGGEAEGGEGTLDDEEALEDDADDVAEEGGSEEHIMEGRNVRTVRGEL